VDDGGLILRRGNDEILTLRHLVHTSFTVKPASYPIVIGILTPGIKRPVRKADHLPPSNAEVRIRGAVPPLIQYVFMAWCLIKHRENFTVILPYLLLLSLSKINEVMAFIHLTFSPNPNQL
jgi:hypothetical protein